MKRIGTAYMGVELETETDGIAPATSERDHKNKTWTGHVLFFFCSKIKNHGIFTRGSSVLEELRVASFVGGSLLHVHRPLYHQSVG